MKFAKTKKKTTTLNEFSWDAMRLSVWNLITLFGPIKNSNGSNVLIYNLGT